MSVHKSITGSSAVEISTSIEAAILSGDFAAGAFLPTVRACAEALGVSPATVAAAYRALRERGLIVTQGRRGTRVSTSPPLPTPTPSVVPEGVLDLATGNPDPTLLPPLESALARIRPGRRVYGERLNDATLVRRAGEQLAADGIPAKHITVVSGALDGIERCLAAWVRAGDRVAVEDPAFSGVLAVLQPLGLVPHPVAIDDRGMRPEALEAALAAGVRAVIATPRAQNPTGAAFDARRARALRKVLRAHPDVLVLEDDHAGPVAGRPAQSICIGAARWAVARSFSKSLGPDLRVAVLTGDAASIGRVEGRQQLGMRWVSHILQGLVVAILEERGTRGRLERAERTYTTRRDALVAALAAHGIEATGRSGLNVWIPVPEEAAMVGALLDSGFAVSAGERFRLQAPPGIRVTTASLEPKDARRLADRIAELLEPSSRTYGT